MRCGTLLRAGDASLLRVFNERRPSERVGERRESRLVFRPLRVGFCAGHEEKNVRCSRLVGIGSFEHYRPPAEPKGDEIRKTGLS